MSRRKRSATIAMRPNGDIANPNLIPEVRGQMANLRALKDVRLPHVKKAVEKVKDNNGIKLTLKIKKECNEVVDLIKDLIDTNQATPQVSDQMLVPLARFKSSMPTFNQASVLFFQKIIATRSATKTTQIVSAASVQAPFMVLEKAWNKLNEALDVIGKEDNMPHAHLIEGKFMRIKQSLELIYDANERKKYPAQNVRKSVRGLQGLCDSLSEKIVYLFKQDIFPFFESDVYSSYKNNIKSFTHIAVKAMKTELPQSGMSTQDLIRMKQAIILDCNEIIESMKMAFSFPMKLKEIKEKAAVVTKDLKEINVMYQYPNNIVKPLEEEVHYSKPPVRFGKENVRRVRIGGTIPNKEGKQNKNEAIPAILERIHKRIGEEYSKDSTIEASLNVIEKALNESLDKNEKLESENKLLVKKIEKLNKQFVEDFGIYQSKMDILSSDAQTKLKKEKEFSKQIEDLELERQKMKNQIIVLQTKLSQANNVHNYEFIKNGLIRIGGEVAKKFELEDTTNHEDDNEMVNSIVDMLENGKFKEYDEFKDEIEDMQSKVQKLAESNNSSFDESLQIIKKRIEDLEEVKNILTDENQGIFDSLNQILINNGKEDETFQYTLQNATISKIAKRIRDDIQNIRNIEADFNGCVDGIFTKFSDNLILTRDAKIDYIHKSIDDQEEKIEKKKKKAKKLKKKLEKKKEKIEVLEKFLSKYFKFTKTSELIAEIEKNNPIEEEKKKLNETIEELQSTTKGVCLRVLGSLNLDPVKDLPLEMLVQTANELISRIQDDREVILMERKKAVDEIDILRNCMIFCEMRLRPHTSLIPVRLDDMSNKSLAARLQQICLKLDSAEVSGRYLQKSAVEDTIKECRDLDSINANTINALQIIAKKFIIMEKTGRSISKITQAANSFEYQKISELMGALESVNNAEFDPRVFQCIKKLIAIIEMTSTLSVCKALGIKEN